MVKDSSGVYLISRGRLLEKSDIAANAALIAVIPGSNDAPRRMKLDPLAQDFWLRFVDKLVRGDRPPK
jgi:hypothetical protein